MVLYNTSKIIKWHIFWEKIAQWTIYNCDELPKANAKKREKTRKVDAPLHYSLYVLQRKRKQPKKKIMAS